MSADKVTPIRTAGDQPPKPPRKLRPQQKREISFGGIGEGPHTLTIWQGLRGVCVALNDIQACIDHESVNRLTQLSAAAAVLSELLDERLMLMND